MNKLNIFLDKATLFLKEISKSVLVFILYLALSILLSTAFNPQITSNNFFVANIFGILVELIIAGTFVFIYRKRLFSDLKEYKNDYKKIMDTAFKNWIIGLIIMIISNIIISSFVGNIANNEELNRTLLLKTPIYAVVAMIIIAPITEEILFRLSPRKAFTKKIPYLIYSAIFFGLMHILASSSIIEILYIIPYGALGFFFAKSFYETNNIFASITTHMIHNTIAVIVAYITMLG